MVHVKYDIYSLLSLVIEIVISPDNLELLYVPRLDFLPSMESVSEFRVGARAPFSNSGWYF